MINIIIADDHSVIRNGLKAMLEGNSSMAIVGEAANGKELIELLSSDVVFHSDGGGKAIALPNMIEGAEEVAHIILDRMATVAPKNLVIRLAQINGEPGFVSYLNGKPFSAFSLNASDGRIKTIFVVTNPQKLSHLPNLPAAPC